MPSCDQIANMTGNPMVGYAKTNEFKRYVMGSHVSVGEISSISEMNTIHGTLDVSYGGDHSLEVYVSKWNDGIIGAIMLKIIIWNALLALVCKLRVFSVEEPMI